jgi:hypothetical protein
VSKIATLAAFFLTFFGKIAAQDLDKIKNFMQSKESVEMFLTQGSLKTLKI